MTRSPSAVSFRTTPRAGARNALLSFSLVTACLLPSLAQAQSWNLYGSSNTTHQLLFSGGAMGPNQPAYVNIRLNGGTLGQAIMDTGSTGIVVGSRYLDVTGLTPVGTGSQAYSSSGVGHSGTYYDVPVTFFNPGNDTTPVARASTVRVLYVDDPNVLYMGVGYNRGNGAPNPTMIPVSANPFLNIDGVTTRGYVISNTGVTLGVPSSANTGFAMVKLVQNSIDWNATSMTISLQGASGTGTVLQDAGINYAFLTPPPGTTLRSGYYLPAGTDVAVSFPGGFASYGFAATAYSNNSCPTPASATVTPCNVTGVHVDSPSIYLNTGREFFAGFDYLYDFDNGYVGYAWTGNVTTGGGTTGQSTSGVALIGDVLLSNGFSSTLPTYLFGPTTLSVLSSGTATIDAVIAGASNAGLTIGPGTVRLLGSNTYSGGTSIASGGTLRVAADAAMGASSGGLAFNGGTLQADAAFTIARTVTMGAGGGTFNTNGNDLVVGSAIGGVGGLTKAGSGILTLSGANAYQGGTTVNQGTLRLATGASLPTTGLLTVNAGTLDLNGNNLTIGSLAGAGGTVALGASTLTVAETGSTTFAGTLAGTGGLTVNGTGNLVLAGVNTYTGPTSVAGGRLAVNGSIASNVTVGSGGNLGGSGTIFGSVVNNGIASPGNSIGTLTVNGTYTQAAGSTYQVETTATGQTDRLNVTGAPGTATINGGMVQVIAAQGVYAPSTTYTILNATGGVAGAYAGVTTSFAFLQGALTYDASNVYLTLRPGGFAYGAATGNQASVGAVLDRSVAGSSGDFATVLGTLSTATLAQGQSAMSTLGGQNYAGFGTANVGSGMMFMSALAQQLAAARGGDPGKATRVALAEACEIEACAPSPWTLWATGLAGFGTVAGNGNTATMTYGLGGAATGIDYRLSPGLLVGGGVGFASGDQWTSGLSGKGSTDSYQLALYASYAQPGTLGGTQGGFWADALAGFAYNDNRMTRQILLPGLTRTATASTGAAQFLGQVEAGYRVALPVPANATIAPFARLQGTTLTQNGFTENGAGSINLTVAGQTTSSLRSTLGAEMTADLPTGASSSIGLLFRLGWVHDFANTQRPVTASFAGAPGSNFTVLGAAPARDAALLAFSASTAIAEATSIYARYDGEVGGGTSAHAITAGFRMNW